MKNPDSTFKGAVKIKNVGIRSHTGNADIGHIFLFFNLFVFF